MKENRKKTKRSIKTGKLIKLIGVATLVLALFHGLFFYYPWLKLSIWFSYGDFTTSFIFIVMLVFPLVGRLLVEFFPTRIFRSIAALAMTWAGIHFLLLFLVLSAQILMMLFYLLGFTVNEFVLASSVLIVCFVVSSYAVVEAGRLNVKEIKLKSEKLSRPYHMVQISDVHIGSRSLSFLKRVVTIVNKQEADLVVITGDLIDMNGFNYHDLQALKLINAPAFFIIGNHERYIHLDEVIDSIKANEVEVIRNAKVTWEELDIIGIDDAESVKQVKRKLPEIEINPSRFNLLLYHRPNGFSVAAAYGIDLMLTGHTHNGQIFPFNFIVKKVFPKIQGLFEKKGSRLYVSSGTGTWGPILRLGSKNEITLIELIPSIE